MDKACLSIEYDALSVLFGFYRWYSYAKIRSIIKQGDIYANNQIDGQMPFILL